MIKQQFIIKQRQTKSQLSQIPSSSLREHQNRCSWCQEECSTHPAEQAQGPERSLRTPVRGARPGREGLRCRRQSGRYCYHR